MSLLSSGTVLSLENAVRSSREDFLMPHSHFESSGAMVIPLFVSIPGFELRVLLKEYYSDPYEIVSKYQLAGPD